MPKAKAYHHAANDLQNAGVDPGFATLLSLYAALRPATRLCLPDVHDETQKMIKNPNEQRKPKIYCPPAV